MSDTNDKAFLEAKSYHARMAPRADLIDVIDAFKAGAAWHSQQAQGEAQSDLLPCPFCGNEAEGPTNESTGRPSWEIRCRSHCIVMRRCKKSEAVSDWNARPLAPAAVPEAEITGHDDERVNIPEGAAGVSGFRWRLPGHDLWNYEFTRSPDSWELREAEVEFVEIRKAAPAPAEPTKENSP